MALKEFTTLDGFYVVDFPEADTASGPMRSAPKILQGGAADLARAQSYTYAALEMRRSGAAGGINATPENRAEAVAAFVAEIKPMVASGAFLPDAAKGVAESELAGLRVSDPRATARFGVDEPGVTDRAEAASAVSAAANLLDGLDGRTVAIEGFGASGPALVAEAVKLGAKVIAISSSEGTITRPEGFEPGSIDWSGEDNEPAWKVFATECDVLFAGSKMGTIDHVGAEKLKVKAVVPSGRLPYTTRALAIFGRSDIATVPDFISLAGSTLALWADAETDTDQLLVDINSTVSKLITEARTHNQGIFVGACESAELFMREWVETMPFGRPLPS